MERQHPDTDIQYKIDSLKVWGYELFHDLSFYDPELISVYYVKDGREVCRITTTHDGDRANMQTLADMITAQITNIARHLCNKSGEIKGYIETKDN